MTNPLSESQALSNVTRISNAINGVTIIGGTSTVSPITNTYSVDFDGVNDYAEIADAAELSFTGDVAFSGGAWVKMDDATRFRVIVKADSSQEYVFTTDGSDRLSLLLYTNNSNYLYKYTTTTLTANEGSWIHIGFTYDGTEADTGIKLFVNGVSQSTGTSNTGTYTGMSDTTVPLRFGYFPSTYANGKMDEVFLVNSELSEANMLAIYNSGMPASLDSYSPVGWWRMGDNDGGTGTTITDQGSSGSNGTLVNGPTFSTDRPAAALPELTNTYSVDFDGSNDFMAADGAASAASGFNGGTWMMWVAPDDASPNTSQTIISFGDDNADSFIQISIGGITQTIITASCTSGGTQQWVINTSNLGWSATDWHHVAIVHNGTDATLYIDGVASGSYTVATNKAIWHNDIAGLDKCTVGAKISNSSTGQYFDGKIDEVAVCETQLTAANLLEIASATTGKATDLDSYSPVGWWRMGDNDGGTGTTVTNQGSGGSSDGTLTNGPTFSTTVQ